MTALLWQLLAATLAGAVVGTPRGETEWPTFPCRTYELITSTQPTT